MLNLAAASAVLWTLAALAVLILSYADISGRPIGSGAEYASELISYVTTLDAGKEKGMTVVVAAVVATACFGVRSLMGLFFHLHDLARRYRGYGAFGALLGRAGPYGRR